MRVPAFLLIGGLLVMNGASTPEQDTQKLQGSWKLTQGTYDGETISDDVRWRFSGDQVTVEVHGGGRRVSSSWVSVGRARYL